MPNGYFRSEDVADLAFYTLHRDAIVEAMANGRILKPGQAPPADGTLVEPPSFSAADLAGMDLDTYTANRAAIHAALEGGRIRTKEPK